MPNQTQEWVARQQLVLPDGEAEGGRRTLARGEPIPQDIIENDAETGFSNLKQWGAVVLSNSDEGIQAYEEYERNVEADAERPESVQEQLAREDAELHDEEYIASIQGDYEGEAEEGPVDEEGNRILDIDPETEREVLAELHSDEYIASLVGEGGDEEEPDYETHPDYAQDEEGNVVARDPEDSAEREAQALEDLHADAPEGDGQEDEEVVAKHGEGALHEHTAPGISQPSTAPLMKPGDARSHVPEATDSALKAAAELGIDIGQVQGSGAGGRVTQRDVQRHASRETEPGEAQEERQPPNEPPGPARERQE